MVFSCEFCKISKNTFFTEHLRTTASNPNNYHKVYQKTQKLKSTFYCKRHQENTLVNEVQGFVNIGSQAFNSSIELSVDDFYIQKQPMEIFWKISQISQENNCLESLFNHVAGLKACNFIEKRPQCRCSPVKFEKFLRTSILKNIPRATASVYFQVFQHIK